MMFQICFIISLHLFLRCIVILLDKVKAYSFQLSKPTSVNMLVLPGPFIWDKILRLKINLDTSEAVFMKTLKHCVKIGLLTD